MFPLGVFVLAVLSGGTAAVAGFGIGSLLTPLLAAYFGTATAVAAVAIPHAAATAFRCWRQRLLLGLSMRQFRYAVAVLIGLLGGWLVVQGVK